MEAIPCRLGFALRRVSPSKQLCSPQKINLKANYHRKSFSKESDVLNRRSYQASHNQALSRGHVALPHVRRTQPSPSSYTPESARRYSNITRAAETEKPIIHELFEDVTGTWQYVVADPSTSIAVVIDPVLDYDPATQTITTEAADSLISLIKEKGYKVDRILETHAHADHLTAASYLQNRLALEQGHRPPICIGKRIEQVQKLFSKRYGIPTEEYGGVFGKLFDDDELFDIGKLKAMAIHLPGHTPDHLGYKIGDNVFCGDSIFHGDIGTARCDFPGGSAKDLFNSGRKLLSLPDHTRIWTGHDYPPKPRVSPIPWMTVEEHRAQNKHLKGGITEEAFVSLRKERDAGLGQPRLLHQALQVNIRAGKLPAPTGTGNHRMLHLPLKLKGLEW